MSMIENATETEALNEMYELEALKQKVRIVCTGNVIDMDDKDVSITFNLIDGKTNIGNITICWKCDRLYHDEMFDGSRWWIISVSSHGGNDPLIDKIAENIRNTVAHFNFTSNSVRFSIGMLISASKRVIHVTVHNL